MHYKSQSLLIIPHWEDWEKKQLRKSWVVCLHKKEKAEGRNFYIISISGKHNNFETLQIPRGSKEIQLSPTFYLVNQDTGIETRRKKPQGKGPVQLSVLPDFF